MKYPINAEPTVRECYGIGPKPIVLSWSRLKDWGACRQRVKLIHEGKRSTISNARNALAGNLTDHCMREALENAPKDDQGRLQEITREQLLAPLQSKWEEEIKPDNRVLKWSGPDPREDQKKILNKAVKALEELEPILQDNILGRRFIPEFRPSEMPVVGIPGPDGETEYIRLFLAVDIAVQLEEGDPDDPYDIGKWGLYDLKTTESEEYLTTTLPQLVFYDIGFHALTGTYAVDHALWAPLVTGTPIRTLKVGNEDRRDILTNIIGYCHGVWAGDDSFTDNPEKECYSCITRSACPRIVQPMSRDEQGIRRITFGKFGEKK